MKAVGVVLVGLMTVGRISSAAETDAPRAAELVAEAEAAYVQGDPELAVKLYRRAHGLTVNPRILLVLAHVHEQGLEDLPGAITYYQLYLASEPEDAAQIRVELEAAQARAQAARLRLTILPAGLSIRLGGEDVPMTDDGATLSVSPGIHQLEVLEADRLRHAVPLTLEAGLNRVHLDLEEPAPPPSSSRTLSWAVTGAALGTGLAWGVVATWAQAEQDRDLAGAADVLLGVAATSAVGAVVAWILE